MRKLFVISAIFAAVTGAWAQGGDRNPSAPVKKFRLPTFSQEGFRTSLLEGEEATLVSRERIEIKEMQYSVFSGTENNMVETTLLAPVATVHILERDKITVEGEGAVRLIRPEIDARGEDWSYDHTHKKLSIGKNVRVVYRAVLKDLLK